MKSLALIAALALATAAPAMAQSPRLYAPDGTFLGTVNANPYDPESISNPYGQYGSPYQPNSINNPYGQYGSPYSTQSVRNPYVTGR